jgi:hypothetical protein
MALNTNNIPHTWKIAKIIPILKPNKDINKGSSYRPIALLSPIAKTLEKIILKHITQYIPNTQHQHGFKKQHSTTTALHTLHNTIARGFNETKPPNRTITAALDMSKAFDTINHNKLIQKLINNTNIPHTYIKFISNYIRGRKGYTIHNQQKSTQRTFRCGVPQGGVLSPILFNIYMADIPTPTNPETNIITYADDITITSTNKNIHTAKTNLQTYLNTIADWIQNNHLTLNTDKTQTTLFTPDPAEYSTKLNITLQNKTLDTIKHPKILGLTLDPKLTYNKHIQNTKTKAQKTLNIYKALTGTSWGKHKETITHTYKSITRPIMEYASTIWGPIATHTNHNKLQTTQNSILRIATGHTADTNTQHLHTETKILPLIKHIQLHTSNLRTRTAHKNHPLNKYYTCPTPPRQMKPTLTHNNFTLNLHTCPNKQARPPETQTINKTLHTQHVKNYINTLTHNKIINTLPLPIHKSEQTLTRKQRRLLAQLRAGKSPLLRQYLHKINSDIHTSPLCPLCKTQPHNTQHLFTCTQIHTTLSPEDLWSRPVEAADLMDRWEERLGE